MRKLLRKKNIKVIRLIEENNLETIPRIVLSSIVVIFFFYSLPIIINFTNSKLLNTDEFQNNSKTILAYTLNKQTNGISNDNQKLDERDLLNLNMMT